MAETHTNHYPKLVIKNIEKPSRLLAFPFFGLLIRCILLVPVGLLILVYSIWYCILTIIVPFTILFTRNIPDSIYNFFIGFLKLYIKASIYVLGLTDKYPGFGLDDAGLFELHIERPKKFSLLLAFPLIGFIIRIVLMIPYIIYESVLQYGAQWAMIFSWFAVLFKGKYPESLYEFNRDFLRIVAAETIYTSYLSDKYPSFHISMNHKPIKILLIILGVLSFLGANDYSEKPKNYDNYNNYEGSPQYLPES
jgi:hypothetical protein